MARVSARACSSRSRRLDSSASWASAPSVLGGHVLAQLLGVAGLDQLDGALVGHQVIAQRRRHRHGAPPRQLLQLLQRGDVAVDAPVRRLDGVVGGQPDVAVAGDQRDQHARHHAGVGAEFGGQADALHGSVGVGVDRAAVLVEAQRRQTGHRQQERDQQSETRLQPPLRRLAPQPRQRGQAAWQAVSSLAATASERPRGPAARGRSRAS
jgi:hypothetical protein